MGKIQAQLLAVQSKLSASKGQFNAFGKYHYRSCEDILEAVKPLLTANQLTLTISDEMVMLGERFYVKATAKVTNTDGESIETTAYAREEETKKGMDASQLTGSTSSYARKYALNGLFCIDDAKDSDSTNTHGKEAVEAPNKTPIDKGPNQNVQPKGSVCSSCKVDIAPAVVAYSKQHFGKELCRDCQAKEKK